MQPKWITNRTARPFYARAEFTVEKPLKEATARVVGLGQFNFFLNGEKVSDHVLDPGWTDYDKAVQYVDFDITGALREGANGVGIEVGNGWFLWDQDFGYGFHFPPFMPPNPNPYHPYGDCLVAWVQIRLTYQDGTEAEFVTDESWQTAPHMVERSNVYGSERIVGAKKQEGFSQAGFSAEGWEKAAEAEAPKGRLVPTIQPPIRVLKTYDGQEIGEAKGMKVYDLGQNVAGLLTARLRGTPGSEVTFYPAEKLDAEGAPDQVAKNWLPIDNRVVYVPATGEEEEFSQVFTYFSGRYLGVSGEAEILSLQAQAISSAWEDAGTFTSSDERWEKIHEMVKRTVEANMMSVHTDCPTIERFAWQEPNHLMAPSIFFMKNGRKLWEKFFFDLREAQHSAEDTFFDMEGGKIHPGDGLVPSQAPCYIPNVLPVPGMGSFYDIVPWGSTIILGVRWHYLFYGDKQVIRDNYEAGVRYLNYLKTKVNEDGFLNHGLGDWGHPENLLARENVETAFLYADAKTLGEFAEILGREREKEEFFSYAEEVRTNYNKKLLYRDEEGFYHYRDWSRRDQGIVSTQTVQALPLYWGMVPPGAKYDIVQELRRQLEEKDHFVAGEVGLPYVIQAAAQNGMSDLVAAYATRETHPSYYAFLKDGETTLGEYWEENPRSHCHDMMGHIVEWIYNGMAGIEPVAPGFREVKLHPWLPEDMDSFTCTYKIGADRDGTIRVEAWRDEDGDPRFRYSLPYWVNVVSSKYPLE